MRGPRDDDDEGISLQDDGCLGKKQRQILRQMVEGPSNSSIVVIVAIPVSDDVLEGATAGDHWQDMLHMGHHHIKQERPIVRQHLPAAVAL